MERKILKALGSKETYVQIRSIIESNELSPLGQLLLAEIDRYYERDASATKVDYEIIASSVGNTINPKHADSFSNTVKAVVEQDVSDANIVNLLLSFRRDRVGRELGARLLNTGKASKEEIDKLLNTYIDLDETINGVLEEKSEILNSMSVAELVASTNTENRIPLYPRSLNEMLEGGAIRGQSIIIFGRPEVGKTLFLVNLIGGFLARNLRVVYFGNEDPIRAVAPRILCRLSGMEIQEIRRTPDVAQAKAYERGYSNLYMKDITPGTWKEMRKDIESIQPDVVVVDQLRHIYCGPLTKVEQMERAAVEARNVAKEYNVLSIGTTQAGDSGDGKLVLEMGDIDFSNTGMQGAVDLLIGIGINDDYDRLSRRMLSLPKNKISGKHEYLPVVYNIPLNKVESL